MSDRMVIGAVAGHHFHGTGDLELVHHCRRGNAAGYMHSRKRLRDRAAFNYDPTMGWERDVWFTWSTAESSLDEREA